MAMGLRFDGHRVALDMAAKPWDVDELAKRAKLSGRTVYRFINNEVQTLTSAKALARALGYSVKRYLIQTERPEAAAS